MVAGLYYILHELRTNFCQMKLPKYLSELARIPISPSEMLTYVIWQECCFVSGKPWGSERRRISNIITWVVSAVTKWKRVYCARPIQFRTTEAVSLLQFGGQTLLIRVYCDFGSPILEFSSRRHIDRAVDKSSNLVGLTVISEIWLLAMMTMKSVFWDVTSHR
jgi:hypothetical protein